MGPPNLGFLRRASSRRLFGDPSQQTAGRGFEPTVSPLLDTVCDRASQKRPAKFPGWRLSIKSLPALSELVDAQLRQALDQELAALESDRTEEDDAALDNDILSALKNGHLIDYSDLEATMADDGTTVEDVVKHAVEEADEQDSAGEHAQAAIGWMPISRRGKASRADGATDAAKELVEKTAEARASAAKPR